MTPANNTDAAPSEDGSRAARFGARLRESRRARQLTRADVALETRIPLRTIALLENGEFDSLPADVFVRGFIRSYAVAIGLDPTATVSAYDACRPASSPLDRSVGNAAGADADASSGPPVLSAGRGVGTTRARRALSMLALLGFAGLVAYCVATWG